jgi:Tfp pilus assembly protein PilO
MGVGIVVLAALVWFFVLSPLRGDIQATEDAIAEEQNQYLLAQTALAQAQATREEGKRNQARLLELSKMIPPSVELPSLLLQIQDLADQSGIDFIAVTPGALISSDDHPDYRILPLDLEFAGTFFDVSDFAYRAEHMAAGPGRLLAIKALSLEPGDAGGGGAEVSPELTVSLSLYAFLSGSADASPTAAPATPTGPTETPTEGEESAQ